MDISDRFRKLPAEINDPNRQKYSTSGVALIESNEQRSVLLVCHDNKKEFDQPNVPSPRFGIVSLDNASLELCYQPLEWPKKSTKLPEDLEGLSGLPLSGQWSFLAQESSGQVFYVEINKSLETGNYIIGNAALCADNLRDISWNKIGTKPTMQFEGFSVQDISTESGSSQDLLAVWAHRGDVEVPQGLIFWGALDKASKNILCADWHEIVVDWPRPKVLKKPEPEIVYTRQISGLKVLPNGTLLIASAIDPGISGPFVGAIYEAGRFFKVADKNYRFVAYRGLELKKLYTTGNPINKEGHKIEGIEPLGDPPGKLVMVTDDENCGPSIAIVDYPPSAV